jgi:hypothetical protein
MFRYRSETLRSADSTPRPNVCSLDPDPASPPTIAASSADGQPHPCKNHRPSGGRCDVVQLAPVGERGAEAGDRISVLRVAGQAAGFDADHDWLIKRAAIGLNGAASRLGAIGDVRDKRSGSLPQ